MAVEVTYAQLIGRMNSRPALQDCASKRRASRLVAAHAFDLTWKSKLRKLTEVVIGSGIGGLAAAAALAKRKRRVLVLVAQNVQLVAKLLPLSDLPTRSRSTVL